MNEIALVLAAGRGTRMRSRLAKVLHPLLGQPMVAFPIAAAEEAGLRAFVVVHHQEEAVRAALGDRVTFVRQGEPRGTGHAVREALAALPATGTLVVMTGDAPLLRGRTLAHLLEVHRSGGRRLTLLSVRLTDPAHYGRVIRDAAGAPVAIVEATECDEAQRAITEINTGVYAFDLAWLHQVLPTFRPHPPKGEIYLTDALEAAAGDAQVLCHDDQMEVLGVNDRLELSIARRVLQDRVLQRWAVEGVTFEDPATTVVELGVELAEDVTVGPGAILRRGTQVGAGAQIGPYCVIAGSRIAPGALIHSHSVLEGAVVGEGATVGPFARLRPQAELAAGAKVGNFVEVKKAHIGVGAKVNHLSYVGDATIGEGANVGAGTITCNYDGYSKHHTEIGAGAFIGSNSALVAPVRVGAGAIVGAGATITSDVPDDAIAVARGEQRVRAGAARRFRERRARKVQP